MTGRIPTAARQLGAAFTAAGFELALVGGSVRDLLLEREIQDIDLATNAKPSQALAILDRWASKSWDVGRAFGTVAGRRGNAVAEITTYRSDVYEPDSRKPQVSYGDSLEGDLSRRDFSVNSMAVTLGSDFRFVDPYGGLRDLATGMLRTPVSPTQSFDDDPLRMMRAARFAAQLGFDVDQAAVAAMTTMAERLSIVSAERIQAELVKLLLSSAPRRGLELMVYTGLAAQVLPELPALELEIDEHHHHKDVYEHTLTVLDQAIALESGPDGPVPGPDLVLRLAALLHDIGKPATRRFEAGGGVSFHHHEVVGAKLAAKRLRALRFDSATVGDVSRLVELHLRFHGYGDGDWSDSAVRRYVCDAGPLLERLHRLTRADCTTRNRRRAERLAFAYDDLERRIAELAEQEELRAMRPDLNGDQIMAILGIPPGRDVGRAYKYLLERRIEEGPLGEARATEALKEWWGSSR
ncbi:MAG: CCA tRNA nucleotidyltransferase [Bifidobacteriaceae bacterium]|nr:CCA tRNA nucleotidyltransferase [Bifidobacteriaceae bacterium]